MTEKAFEMAKYLRDRIAELEAAVYAVDVNTKGTIGHTGKCSFIVQTVETKRYFWLKTRDNRVTHEITIPYDVALKVGDVLKGELKKLYQELNDL